MPTNADEVQQHTIAALKRAASGCQYSSDQHALLNLAAVLASMDEDENAFAQLAVLRGERDEARAQRDEANDRADRAEQNLASAQREIGGLKGKASELEGEIVTLRQQLEREAAARAAGSPEPQPSTDSQPQG